MQYVDANTYLIDDIMVKVDKASMLNSLETRAPLLDHCLAEYVASVSPSLRINNGRIYDGRGKYLLQKVASELLPASILERPKRGFEVPISRWFNKNATSYAHDQLSSVKSQSRGLFDPKFLQELLKTDGTSKVQNHSQALWSLLCLELWFQTYMDEPTTQAEHQPIPVINNR